jgi:CheY-like chemotaxis protein
VDDVLDFSRLEAGKVRLENKAFELSSLCEEVVELLAPRAHGKALELALCISPQAQGVFEGDASRLRQILLNLIGNSVKFTETGGVKVEVALSKTVEGQVDIAVTDTGPGIPLAAQEQIFREFEQVEQGLARKHGGSGLGLAISAKLARLMGGELRLEHSETGKGAKFVASLPLQSLKTVEAVANRPPNGKRAMIWSSLVHESTMWAQLLEAHGYEVHSFTGFDAEPDSALLAKAEIVIFDNYVLGKHRQVLERLEARRIVALTPEERQGVLPRQAELPLDGFLIRPVRQEALALVSRAQTMAEQKAQAPRANAPQDFSGISVLVAEDNDINALLTEKILESLGAKVMRVSDGLEALEALSLQSFDLVFMDVHMPMMDGLEASNYLTEERDKGAPHPPVIALTANSSVEDREKCLNAGMSDFLVKPVSQQHIADVLQKWLPERGATMKQAEAL